MAVNEPTDEVEKTEKHESRAESPLFEPQDDEMETETSTHSSQPKSEHHTVVEEASRQPNLHILAQSSDPEQLESGVKEVKRWLPSLQGALSQVTAIDEHTLADWNATLEVNLTGTFLMTRQALPALLDSRRGVVVTFTSTAASFAHPYMAAYAASKGGVLSFTHSLALEYAKQGLRALADGNFDAAHVGHDGTRF